MRARGVGGARWRERESGWGWGEGTSARVGLWFGFPLAEAVDLEVSHYSGEGKELIFDEMSG